MARRQWVIMNSWPTASVTHYTPVTVFTTPPTLLSPFSQLLSFALPCLALKNQHQRIKLTLYKSAFFFCAFAFLFLWMKWICVSWVRELLVISSLLKPHCSEWVSESGRKEGRSLVLLKPPPPNNLFPNKILFWFCWIFNGNFVHHQITLVHLSSSRAFKQYHECKWEGHFGLGDL